MEQLEKPVRSMKQWIAQRLSQEAGAKTVWAIPQPDQTLAYGEGEGIDLLFIIATEDTNRNGCIKNYSLDGLRIQERWVSMQQLNRAMATGYPRFLVQWLERGEIWMDQHDAGEHLNQTWKSFPNDWREQQLLQEFSQVVQEFHATKQYIERGHTLDAFSSMLQTMTHWARIVVIEKGMHPEILVWEQVREYNAGVYKLYEELLTSNETIAQRVELVMLAAEFSMMSKMKSCCALLLRVLENNEDPMSVDQIRNHPNLEGLRVEWSGLLSRLAKRGMIREVHLAYSEQLDAIELAYCKN